MEKLTDGQKIAIEGIDESMAVIAAAGSGKTTVLIRRCLQIIGDKHAELDRLLAITFTEKAAAELKSRLRPHLPPLAHHRLTTAWIGTFHGCCARMLRQHAPLVGLDPAFAILDENASRLISRNAIKTTLLAALEAHDPHAVLLVDALDFRSALGMIEDLMDFRWHARRALAKPATDDEEEREILGAAAHVYGLCEAAYHDALASQNACDFQDLEIRTLELLDDHPDVLKSYRRRFRHILIDEFQDTNDLQTELVAKIFTPGTNTLCIVGDPRQSIYRFRGANVDCFRDMLSRIRRADGRVVPLMHNFRSHPDIVAFVNSASDELQSGLFGSHADDEGVLTSAAERMVSAREEYPDGPAVVKLAIGDDDAGTAAGRRHLEAEAIARHVGAIVASGTHKLGDIVCLFQALTNVTAYEAAFKEHGIPYRFFGGRGLLDRQEICDLMHVLRYAANPQDDLALVGILRSPLVGISDAECASLAGPDGKAFHDNARAHQSCALLHTIERLAPHLRPSELLRAVIDETGYEWIMGKLDASGGMSANVDRLIMLAGSLERQAPTTPDDFISFIAHLREHNARVGDPPAAGDATDAVHCMTVHTAKGLEFPVVILPDLFRQEPSASRPWMFHRQEGCALKLKDPVHPFGHRIPTERFDHIRDVERFQADAERARLLYVAMTRARDVLVLPIHRSEKVKGKWHEWLRPLMSEGVTTASPDVFVIPSAAEGSLAVALRNDKIPTYDRAKVRSYERTNVRTFSVSQLEAFDRCPQEFYLKYVLGVPAANLLQEAGRGLAANVRGSIIHNVLENLSPACADKLGALIGEACMEHDVYPDDDAVADIIDPIRRFMATPLFEGAATGERETRFDWRLGNNSLTGYIDWYRPTDEGLEIVDFKTDRVDEDGATLRALEYDLQMMSYTLALEKASGTKVAATALVFLTPGTIRRNPVDDARRRDALQRIDTIMSRIRNDDFAIAGIHPPCEKCPYHANRMCWKDRLIAHD